MVSRVIKAKTRLDELIDRQRQFIERQNTMNATLSTILRTVKDLKTELRQHRREQSPFMFVGCQPLPQTSKILTPEDNSRTPLLISDSSFSISGQIFPSDPIADIQSKQLDIFEAAVAHENIGKHVESSIKRPENILEEESKEDNAEEAIKNEESKEDNAAAANKNEEKNHLELHMAKDDNISNATTPEAKGIVLDKFENASSLNNTTADGSDGQLTSNSTAEEIFVNHELPEETVTESESESKHGSGTVTEGVFPTSLCANGMKTVWWPPDRRRLREVEVEYELQGQGKECFPPSVPPQTKTRDRDVKVPGPRRGPQREQGLGRGVFRGPSQGLSTMGFHAPRLPDQPLGRGMRVGLPVLVLIVGLHQLILFHSNGNICALFERALSSIFPDAAVKG